ncbi:tetratricopeptide repeat protein [bacterium]|nr:tetratricopeptide repeat protein [bacterium]
MSWKSNIDAKEYPSHAWFSSPVWPLLIAAGAAMLRIWHIENSQISPVFWVPTVDPGWYHEAARRIAEGNWGPFPLFRAPLYPALLGLSYDLFGEDLVAARMLNVFLQSLTVLVIYWIGRRYMTTAIGLLAAMLFSLNGMAIYFCGEILSVSLEMLLMALCIWTLFALWNNPGYMATAVCGLIWGLAAITRPNFLILFPLPIIALVFTAYGRQQISEYELKKRWTPPLLRWIGRSIIWLVFAGAMILPVTYLNYSRGGEFVLIATQGGVNFWIGNNPESTGITSDLPGYGPFWTEDDAIGYAQHETGRILKPGAQSGFYYKKGWSFILDHPGDAVLFMVRKAALFFNRFELSNNKHIGFFAGLSPWLPKLIYLNLGVLLPLSLLGFWVYRSRAETRILGIMTALFAVSVILFFVTSRFRMPVIPPLVLLSAGGLTWMASSLRRRFAGGTGWAFLILIPGAALAWMNPWNLQDAAPGSAYYMEGNAYLTMAQPEKAESSFRKSLQYGGPADMAHVNLGVLAYRAGQADSAQSHYAEALSVNPSNYLALNNLAVIYELQGDTIRAMSTYLAALKLRPQAADPSRNLASLYLALGVQALKRNNLQQATIYLRESVQYFQTSAAHYNLAIAYGRSGNPTQAVMELDRALELNPGYAAARELRNQIFASPSGAGAEAPVPPVQDQAPAPSWPDQ